MHSRSIVIIKGPRKNILINHSCLTAILVGLYQHGLGFKSILMIMIKSTIKDNDNDDCLGNINANANVMLV